MEGARETKYRRADVEITADDVRLEGDLAIPRHCLGVVLFAHGSGSSRRSPRNALVARCLNEENLATLLFDLLVPSEAEDRRLVFDVPFLAERLLAATARIREDPDVGGLPAGYFGASTGAAAALWAAAEPGVDVAAIVSRGGRPDLAGPRLAAVLAPTLLIVGGRDAQVLELNRSAQAALRCPSELQVVSGASHLFEEPGALETAGRAARDWFVSHLGGASGDA